MEWGEWKQRERILIRTMDEEKRERMSRGYEE